MADDPHALTNPVQTRFESISMRLDAATDTLLQTRDLLIRHLEHQMLQLDEVRKALHETSTEAAQWAEQVREEAKPTPPEPQAPLQPAAAEEDPDFSLERLFAPLNSVPARPEPREEIADSQTPISVQAQMQAAAATPAQPMPEASVAPEVTPEPFRPDLQQPSAQAPAPAEPAVSSSTGRVELPPRRDSGPVELPPAPQDPMVMEAEVMPPAPPTEPVFNAVSASEATPPAPPSMPEPIAPPAAPQAPVQEVPAEPLFDQAPAPEPTPEPPNKPAISLEAVAATLAGSDADPALEKATLDELNEALTRAFAQIAAKREDSSEA